VAAFVRSDRCGLLLALGLAGWTAVSALGTGADRGDAAAVVGLVALAAGAYGLGRVVGLRHPWLPPVAVAAVAVVAALPPIAGRSGHAPAGALGYSNASAELFLQGFAAALLVLALADRRAWAISAAVVAAVLAAVTIRAGSIAATGLLVVPAAALVAAAAGVYSRRALLALEILLVVALVGTIVLGAWGGGGSPGDRPVAPLIDATLSGRRIALWHDALVLMAEHPIIGVGPGRFRVESPTARADPDARWAHNGFLQQGAETGVPGLVLLLGIFLWGLARLQGSRAPAVAANGGGPRLVAGAALGGGPRLVAGAAVAALGIHACVDYVLHFPVLPIAAAAILGSAVPRAHRREGTT
jgi:O-antigen ligase